MTYIEYDLLRFDRPDLMLPTRFELSPENLTRLKFHSRRSLIAIRTAILLGREFPQREDSFSVQLVQSTNKGQYEEAP